MSEPKKVAAPSIAQRAGAFAGAEAPKVGPAPVKKVGPPPASALTSAQGAPAAAPAAAPAKAPASGAASPRPPALPASTGAEGPPPPRPSIALPAKTAPKAAPVDDDDPPPPPPDDDTPAAPKPVARVESKPPEAKAQPKVESKAEAKPEAKADKPVEPEKKPALETKSESKTSAAISGKGAAAIDNIREQLNKTSDNIVKNDLLLKLIDASKAIALGKLPPASLNALMRCLRLLMVDKEQAIRSQAFRVMRYLCTDELVVKEMCNVNMDLFLARSLERDSKYLWERMQSLKLIRRMMTVDSSLVPRSIVQALVAIAEHAKDDFRRVSLDAVRELVLINPDIVASCNGVRTIIDSILDPSCQDIACSLTLTLLFLLDQESTRRYLRPSLDILKLMSVFTDTGTPNSPDKEARRAAAHKALVTTMRSWTGILCLTSDPQGLRSLIQLLGLPPSVKGASWAREAIFDLLFEIMHVVKSADVQAARHKNVWGRHPGPNLLHNYIVMILLAFMDCGLVEILTKLGMSADKEFSTVATNLLTEILYLSSDLLPRSMCARLNALPSVVARSAAFTGDVSTTSRVRALNMVTGLSHPKFMGASSDTYTAEGAHGAQIDPPSPPADSSYLTRGQGERTVSRRDEDEFSSRPGGGGGAGGHGRSFDGGRRREQKGVAHGIKIDRLVQRTDIGSKGDEHKEDADRKDSVRLHQSRILHYLRHQMDTHMDDNELQSLLKKSQVVNGKDYKTWDFSVCIHMLEGPLTTATALNQVLKTKFIKRLLSFLKPSKKFFSDLDWSPAHVKYARMALRLFRVMLGNSEGREYEHFRELIDEIFSTLFTELGKTAKVAKMEGKEVSSAPDSKTSGVGQGLFSSKSASKSGKPRFRCFERRHVSRKLAREYFSMIGLLSTTPHGQNSLDRWELYQTLDGITKDPTKDYLMRQLIAHLDYSAGNMMSQKALDGWVREGSVELRLFALSHLRVLLRALSNPDEFVWATPLLVAQLAHDNKEVALAALAVLEECCHGSMVCLEEVIRRKPVLKGVGPAAHNLQLLFLSSKAGVEYLQSTRWIEPQLRYWRSGGGNQRYVETLENSLVASLSAGGADTAAAAALQLKHTPSSARSEGDDYYFRRVHQIPWTVDLAVEYPQGRKMELNCEAYVHTGFQHLEEIKEQATAAGQPVDEDAEPGLVTYIVAHLLDFDGKYKPYKIDSNVTIRSRLTVGSGPTLEVPPDMASPRAEASTPRGSGMSMSIPRSSTAFLGRSISPSPMGRSFAPGTSPMIDENKDPGAFHNSFFSGERGASEQVCRPDARTQMPNDKGTGGYCLVGDGVRWNFLQEGKDLVLESVWFRIPTTHATVPGVSLSPHLYGELAKTEEGCALLKTSGHVREFVDTIKDTHASSVQKRAALWAIGHIGSSPLGFALLEGDEMDDIITFVSEQAMACPTLSMRGTCFYILGLLSRTTRARSLLTKLGWDFSPHPQSGIVVPTNVSQFLAIPGSTFAGAWAADRGNVFGISKVPGKAKGKEGDLDDGAGGGGGGAGAAGAAGGAGPAGDALVLDGKENVGTLILGHISNLCNHVTQKGSLNALRTLRSTHKELFSSPLLLLETLKLLAAYTYRLPARRFILFDLFNLVEFNQQTITVFDQKFAAETNEEALQKQLAPLVAAALQAQEAAQAAQAGASSGPAVPATPTNKR